jgi:hypothetical protein
MFGYNFFPFVVPTNLGTVELPDFDTVMSREDVKFEETEVDQATGTSGTNKSSPSPEQSKKRINIDDLAIDFEKVKVSRGRQSKDGKGYKQDVLKVFGKELKKRGFNIDLKSKDSLIDSILLLE